MRRMDSVLVVGGGSAGIRHFRYLTEAGIACSVCDPSGDCRVLREFPDAPHYGDLGGTDLSRFDGVVIATPPFLHMPHALRAARAGCHVLLEKPLSVTDDRQIDELGHVVAKKGLVAAVAFPFANMPALDYIAKQLEQGAIGKVWSVAIHHGQNILKYRPDYYQTYYPRDEEGGGCLQDDALHPVMGLEILFGREIELTCQRHSIGITGDTITADDTAWFWIRYPNDVIAEVDFSLQCHWRHNEWVIAGSKGAMRFLVDDNVIETFDAETEQTHREAIEDSWDETFRRNDENFIRAVRHEEPVRCTIARARDNLRAVLAARRSADTGQSVRVDWSAGSRR